MLSKVVFPEPFAPRSKSTSPSYIDSEALSKTTCPPKALRRLSARSNSLRPTTCAGPSATLSDGCSLNTVILTQIGIHQLRLAVSGEPGPPKALRRSQGAGWECIAQDFLRTVWALASAEV